MVPEYAGCMKNGLLLLAVIGFCFNPASLCGQRTGAGRLVFDQAHGEQPPPPQMNVVTQKLGLEIQTSTGAITADTLKGARILYLRAPSTEFTAAEADAIVAFVKDGGSLLLVQDEERRQPLEKTRVNTFLSPFGMKLTLDTEYLHNNGAVAKAGEINKADREVPFSGLDPLLGQGQRRLHGGSPDVALQKVI